MTEVRGGWRDFQARAACTEPDRVWWLWTTPDTWRTWDKGLTSAHLEGAFRVGAVGTVVGLDGRRSRFVVDEVRIGELVRWHVPLPGGRMTLTRSLVGDDGRQVVHRVRITGPLSAAWGLLLGRRFKPLLGPPVDDLVTLAQQPTHQRGEE